MGRSPFGAVHFLAVGCVRLRTLVVIESRTAQNGGPPRGQAFGQRLEYWCLRVLVAALGALPRPLARAEGAALGVGGVSAAGGGCEARGTARNLAMAFPEKSEAERKTDSARRVPLAWAGNWRSFAGCGGYTLEKASKLIRLRGPGELPGGAGQGQRGVRADGTPGSVGAFRAFITRWPGYPMSMVIRRLDNPLVDAFVNRIRSLHGNRVIHKDDFARGLLTAMHQGEIKVGILMDTNMTPRRCGNLLCRSLACRRAQLQGSRAWPCGRRQRVLRGFLGLGQCGEALCAALWPGA